MTLLVAGAEHLQETGAVARVRPIVKQARTRQCGRRSADRAYRAPSGEQRGRFPDHGAVLRIVPGVPARQQQDGFFADRDIIDHAVRQDRQPAHARDRFLGDANCFERYLRCVLLEKTAGMQLCGHMPDLPIGHRIVRIDIDRNHKYPLFTCFCFYKRAIFRTVFAVRILRSPPIRRVPQGVCKLLLRQDENRDLQAEPTLDHALDLPGQRRGLRFLAGKDHVPAVQP